MEDISVADIAVAAGISQSFLCRLFHDEKYITPVAKLQQLHPQRAKHLKRRVI
jgi:transcriptional regulator GlxA family with amidase domain